MQTVTEACSQAISKRWAKATQQQDQLQQVPHFLSQLSSDSLFKPINVLNICHFIGFWKYLNRASLSFPPSCSCSYLYTLPGLRPLFFLPNKGTSHVWCQIPCQGAPPSLLTFQNHLDHREWVNHIRDPEERWEVDSIMTGGVALARLIPLGRGKRGTPSRLHGWERKKHFPRNEFTCMVTQWSRPVDAY